LILIDIAYLSLQQQHNGGGNFLRPIAFKPIPFEPDYRIASQHHQHHHQQQHHHPQQQQQQATGQQPVPGERYGYGSTPSLVPLSTAATHKFGSKLTTFHCQFISHTFTCLLVLLPGTTDLRHLAARRRGHRAVQRTSNEDSLGLGLGLGLGLECLSGHDRPDGASRLVLEGNLLLYPL